MRAYIDLVVALPFALLPKRRWDSFDLPILNVVLPSSLITMLGGAALGITGYFDYMAYVLEQRAWTAPPFMIYVFISYVLATPQGLFSLYLTFSGFIRCVAWMVDEPTGDPILSGLDALVSRSRTSHQAKTVRNARERLEGADEPDRLHDGAWAGLPDATYVVVAARRKPGWSNGTWVITSDGWFTLGEPLDRQTPHGLRTIYPLTLQTTTLDVLRKGVSYELPPLRASTPRKRG